MADPRPPALGVAKSRDTPGVSREMPTASERVVVIGAGPAGLATAAMLGRRGIRAVVLERSSDVAASWRRHYDRLHLHTVRWLSHLPGYRIPRAEGPWVSRDGVVRYLEQYARRHRLEIRTETPVERVERFGAGVPNANRFGAGDPLANGWLLRSPAGDVATPAVVVATGYNHTPVLPEWPGRDSYTGDLLHARYYRNGSAYRGRDVLVVGAGNTGAEIAVDLVEHGATRVRLAVRRPPHVLRRAAFGIPSQLTGVMMRRVPVRIADAMAEPVRRLSVPDLTHKGLAAPEEGLFTRARRGEIPVLDVGLVDAVQGDRVEPVAAVTGFDGPKVLLADGDAIAPEVVVVATGYAQGLGPLVGHLGLLDDAGRPVVHGARTHPANPSLYFIGFSNPISGMFREIGFDARRIAAAVRSSLT
jgi:putative flavoprotein involved in K+ transport